MRTAWETYLPGVGEIEAGQRQFCFSYNKSVRVFNRLIEEGLVLPGNTKSVWIALAAGRIAKAVGRRAAQARFLLVY